MLPFEGYSLIFSYAAALGAYTLLAKTAGLLAVVWAVSDWSWAEILGSILCSLAAPRLNLSKQRRQDAGRAPHNQGVDQIVLVGCQIAEQVTPYGIAAVGADRPPAAVRLERLPPPSCI